jgi:outer membrane protein OmpA-like peptidoglycan-associated protein
VPLASAQASERYDLVGGSSPTGDTMAARARHTATLLPGGRVLLVGGWDGAAELASAELYDPSGDAFSLAPALTTPRADQTATLLPEGKVVVTGGVSGGSAIDSVEVYGAGAATISEVGRIQPARAGHVATLLPAGRVLLTGGGSGSAELLDRASDQWTTVTPAGYIPRRGHTATLLVNGPDAGKVLVVGGVDPYSGYLQSAQLYDPAARTVTALPNLGATRAYHSATVLPDGRVLIAGGRTGATSTLSSARLYDPPTRTWVDTGPLLAARAFHTATLLPNGKVLVAGGDLAGAPYSTAEIYDPAAGAFTASASVMGAARTRHAAALLRSGRVLLAGGEGHASADVYDATTDGFSAVGAMASVRSQFTATSLPDGRVLVAGGTDGTMELGTAELFDGAASFSSAPGTFTPRFDHSAALLPTGEVILAGGEDASGYLPIVERYEPASGRFVQAGISPLNEERGSFTTTLLPSGQLLAWGGHNADPLTKHSLPELYDVFSPPAATPPDLSVASPYPSRVPGAVLNLTPAGGASFTGGLDTSSGDTRSSAANQPVFVLEREGGEGFAVAQTRSFSAGSAQVRLPDPLVPGWWWLRAVVAGVPGKAVSVYILDPFRITPEEPSVPPRGSVAFSAAGGSGTGYVWAVAVPGSADAETPAQPSIDPATGAYLAGALGGTSDVIRAVDALGNHAEVTVEVTTPLVIAPTSAATTPLGAVAFGCSGGFEEGGYTWSLSSSGSGGSVNASGAYQAGRTGSVTDVVRCTDTLGSFAEASITVGPAVTVSPAGPGTPPRGSLAFAAEGGTGTGYTWSLSTNASGATIDAATGAYTAGATPSVTDVVRVQDSLGNFATTSVTVGPGITVTPADAGAYPGQTVTLTATGGSGAGYTWSMVTVNSNGGHIDASTGVYTAGTTRGVTDVVRVTDSLGNQATVDVAVWPDWKPSGSGCSSLGGGGSGALGLVLLALWLALRGRPGVRKGRRSFRHLRAGAALLLLAVAGTAQAQVPPVSRSFVVDRFQPSGGAYDVLGVESAQVGGHLEKTFRLYGDYASRPLVLEAPAMDKVALLKSQTALNLTLSLGLADWAEVSAAIPAVVSQSREQDRFLPPELRGSVASSGLGDVRIVPKVRLVEWRKVRLGVAAPFSLPTGNKKAFLGQGAFTGGPEALVEVDGIGPARLLLNAGAVFRPERKLVDLTVGNALTYGAGLELPFLLGGEKLAAQATLDGEHGMNGGKSTSPLEALAALRWLARNGFEVTVGGGPGIGKGYGTPQYRVFAGIGFSTASTGRLREKEPAPEPVREEPKVEQPKPEEPKPVAKAEEPKPEPAKVEEKKVEEPKPAEPAAEVEPLPEPTVMPDGSLRIDSRVYFDFDKKEIKPQYKPVLDHVAKRILEEPRMKVVRIEGHADEYGPPEYNLWLSEQRARAVKDYLQHAGVPKQRIVIVGYGKTHPAVPGHTRADHAKNRRVEFNVQER